MSKLIVAIDTGDLGHAVRLARDVYPHVAMVKLGLEFFTAHGPEGVHRIIYPGRGDEDVRTPFMLDLKLHDIPNTVAGAVTALLPMHPEFITVHAAGGERMVEAARRAAESRGKQRPKIIAVTMLTSLISKDMHSIFLNHNADIEGVAHLMALRAMDWGADGVVCSPHEAARMRSWLRPSAIIITPGIRAAGSPPDDQARTATAAEAVAAGADYVVVGRPITTAPDPRAMAEQFAKETQQ